MRPDVVELAPDSAPVLERLQSMLTDRKPTSEGSFGAHLPGVPHIKCGSRLTLSVQASAYHYCGPRESKGPWWAVEVGFPSVAVPELMPWAEDPGRPTETVYGWVPIELVANVISANGGFASPQPKDNPQALGEVG